MCYSDQKILAYSEMAVKTCLHLKLKNKYGGNIIYWFIILKINREILFASNRFINTYINLKKLKESLFFSIIE
ncbi:unnamed protein product [Blepharisma stoltei]|uniref:Uncharacterized protein n=1 Tax=Blepharisma stoltei TaxID=1481888 RepID=A0AAU9IPR7_9CILI|nr:unnamed protein product [Blepharisma stoltei]